MPAGSVYVSCSRADRTAAQRLAAVLDEAGLDAWFDRNDIQSGPRYDNRIRQYMDRFGVWTSGFWNKWYHGIMKDKPGDHSPVRGPAPAE